MSEWWKTFFDQDYVRLWGAGEIAGAIREHAEAVWELLGLREGSRLLDAPCGYGRVSEPMARRGAVVVGVDQSAEMLAQAERDRGDLPVERLRYVRHDLREPLAQGGFDAAMNLFTSIGYGSDEDDLAILRTLRGALRPGGKLVVETMHRDVAVALFSRGLRPAQRLADGTLVVEEPVFDPIAGRVNTAWYWSGPSGSGRKEASLRIYTITELVRLLEAAELRFVSAHGGSTTDAFRAEGPEMGGRVMLVAEAR
ncbi:MAG TPA: class I SAM-dependent methyltransferase [Acidobacteriaceae bacterium]|jgi:SAM-dependent methyltransferase|nr:class I SAM-dependent methyltransferase [Acidobacteriaceae bacterium]